MSDDRSTLEAAYLATTFRVEAPNGNIDIRVGPTQQKIDALLVQVRATEWAYVTAWNPGSRRERADQNTFAQDELLRLVRDRGFVFYEGLGIPDLEGWAPERSAWIAGIGRREAIELGRQFGQNAIVIGSLGGVV